MDVIAIRNKAKELADANLAIIQAAEDEGRELTADE